MSDHVGSRYFFSRFVGSQLYFSPFVASRLTPFRPPKQLNLKVIQITSLSKRKSDRRQMQVTAKQFTISISAGRAL